MLAPPSVWSATRKLIRTFADYCNLVAQLLPIAGGNSPNHQLSRIGNDKRASRDLAEFSVDILVKRLDPGIGQKVATAALLRSPEFPLLLILAYSRGLAASTGISNDQAAKMIRVEEDEFRQRTIAYGQVLTLDDATAIQQISDEMAQLAQTLLALNGVTPIPPPEALVPLISFAINQGVILCEPDYAANIESTITDVKTNLAAHGISY
jgi:hypothetical protein